MSGAAVVLKLHINFQDPKKKIVKSPPLVVRDYFILPTIPKTAENGIRRVAGKSSMNLWGVPGRRRSVGGWPKVGR